MNTRKRSFFGALMSVLVLIAFAFAFSVSPPPEPASYSADSPSVEKAKRCDIKDAAKWLVEKDASDAYASRTDHDKCSYDDVVIVVIFAEPAYHFNDVAVGIKPVPIV